MRKIFTKQFLFHRFSEVLDRLLPFPMKEDVKRSYFSKANRNTKLMGRNGR